MNFTHLHKTNAAERFAFFVHECESQPEAPKPVIHSSDQLQNLVAKMVQKGLDFTAKATQSPPTPPLPPPPPLQAMPPQIPPTNGIDHHHHHHQQLQEVHQQQRIDGHELLHNQAILPPLHHNPLEITNLEPAIQLNQLVPLHNMENIKLEVPQFQPITQLLVSESDMGEPILFCQPTIMLDPTTQVIPVSQHSFSSHFVQLHSTPNLNNQQGQYL